MIHRIFLSVLAVGLISSVSAWAKVVHYDLKITRTPINVSGRGVVDFSLLVNGVLPAPTLEFTEGDEAEITVINGLDHDEEVSIHWHGILLPPEQDGVPYSNTPPIPKGATHTFRFKIRQHGTYWYHSHTGLQEQKGVYGALIIHPRRPTMKVDHDVPVVISDWSDESPESIFRHLRKDGDYYARKKESVRSYFGAWKAGGLGRLFKNELQRMPGMDLSDVGYDAFLINARRELQLVDAKPGDRVRLRLINAAASSYFTVSLAGLPMEVISADGLDIQPVLAKELLMGMAETYDVLFTVPDSRNYELRATAQDVSGFASAWLGPKSGAKVAAPAKLKPDLYAEMSHDGMNHDDHHQMASDSAESTAKEPMDHESMDHDSMDHESHQSMSHGAHMDHSTVGQTRSKDATPSKKVESSHADHGEEPSSISTSHRAEVEMLTVDDLQSPTVTTLSASRIREIKLVLGGDMERYVWYINGKAIFQDHEIPVVEGEIVRFIFVNDTMMHHPMHLHGHFFRVLNRFGERSPLKHTVDVSPHGTRTIELLANEPGTWMLHCHNLYHMKTGMARMMKYVSYKPSAEIAHLQHQDPHMEDPWYGKGRVTLSSNLAEALLSTAQTWNQFDVRIESRPHEIGEETKWQGEGDLLYRRWIGSYLNVVLGGTRFGDEDFAAAGFSYHWPLMIGTQVLVDSDRHARIDLERRFQWTSTIVSDLEVRWRSGDNQETETLFTVMYAPSWSWSGGLTATNESVGLGLSARF